MIGVLIPDRNDRPKFLKHALFLIKQQTLKPDFIHVMNDKAVSDAKDITWRYRIGLKRCFDAGCKIVFLWENDDWYCRTYLDTLYKAWLQHNQPDIFGIADTLYYHIWIKKYVLLKHLNRASAMSTLVTKKVLDIKWCADDEIFTDICMWRQMKGVSILFPERLCVGIKHGEGLSGGIGHKTEWNKYTNADLDFSFLRSIVDKNSFEFYSQYENTLHLQNEIR